MTRKFRPNPMRQAILVALALVGLGIGYGAGYLFKPNPPSRAPAAAGPSAIEANSETASDNEIRASNAAAPPAPAPMMPEGNGEAEGTPYRAYEESLPKDILENGDLPAVQVTDSGSVPEEERPPNDRVEPTAEAKAKADPDGATQPSRDEKIMWADSQKPADGQPQGAKLSEPPPETASLPTEPEAKPAAPAAAPEPVKPEPTETAIDRETLPTWRKNAVEVASNAGPLVAIVIDDMGVDRGRTRRAWNLPGPLTLSFLTYSKDIARQMADARKQGHELLLHVPMEPSSPDIDPGPNVLITGMPREEILANLNWTLDQADGYVGINNHMGSRFTSELAGMSVVMETLKERGLLFLDSVTSPKSAGRKAATAAGVPFIARNIFLDHVDDVDEIRGRLKQTADMAKRRGHAVAIAHPRDATIDALEPWLKELSSQGIQLAPLSAILMRATERLSARNASTEPPDETADHTGSPELEPDHSHAEPAEPQTAQQSEDEPAAEDKSEEDKP